MRDLLVITIVATAALHALRHPWVGVTLWTWLSIMNPHRYTWGFAYDAPVAQIAAIATLVGLLVTKDVRESPFKGLPPKLLAVFCVWMTASWLFGLGPAEDYAQWNKIMKVYFMVFVGLAVLHQKKHVIALAWVCALSLGLLGVKSGIYTITTGGGGRVWGPAGTFIADNNEFALALILVIPLLRFLQMQLINRWGKHALSVMMLLSALGSLGSQSRGALLALAAMTLLLWWRGRSRLVGGLLIALLGVALIGFMPDTWSDRMGTIQTYEEDGSAMGRISAWWNAWNLAFHYPLGVGFNAARHELFQQFSPYYKGNTHAAHSIYFQILGNHGFIGLFIYLALWVTTWRSAAWLRTHGAKEAQARWASDLGAMCQVSLMGFAVGGAFLSLSYWDLPYNIMMMVVVARVWVQTQAWKTEPVAQSGWRTLPGMLGPGTSPAPSKGTGVSAARAGAELGDKAA